MTNDEWIDQLRKALDAGDIPKILEELRVMEQELKKDEGRLNIEVGPLAHRNFSTHIIAAGFKYLAVEPDLDINALGRSHAEALGALIFELQHVGRLPDLSINGHTTVSQSDNGSS